MAYFGEGHFEQVTSIAREIGARGTYQLWLPSVVAYADLFAQHLERAAYPDLNYLAIKVLRAHGTPSWQTLLADVGRRHVLAENLKVLSTPAVRLRMSMEMLYSIYNKEHDVVALTRYPDVLRPFDYPPLPTSSMGGETRTRDRVELHDIVCEVCDIPRSSKENMLSTIEPILFRLYAALGMEPVVIVGYLCPSLFELGSSSPPPRQAERLVRLYSCYSESNPMDDGMRGDIAMSRIIDRLATAGNLRDFFWTTCGKYPGFAFSCDASQYEIGRNRYPLLLPSHRFLFQECIASMYGADTHVVDERKANSPSIDFATVWRTSFSTIVSDLRPAPAAVELAARKIIEKQIAQAPPTLSTPVASEATPAIAKDHPAASKSAVGVTNDADLDSFVSDLQSRIGGLHIRQPSAPVVRQSAGLRPAEPAARVFDHPRPSSTTIVRTTPAVVIEPQKAPIASACAPVLQDTGDNTSSESETSESSDDGHDLHDVSPPPRPQASKATPGGGLLAFLGSRVPGVAPMRTGGDLETLSRDNTEMGRLRIENDAADTARAARMQADLDRCTNMSSSFGGNKSRLADVVDVTPEARSAAPKHTSQRLFR